MNRLTKSQKLTAQFLLGVVVVIAGLVMLFMGIFLPPLGIIDSSILVAFGESATFAGALIGVDYNYKYKTYKISREFEIDEKEDEEL